MLSKTASVYRRVVEECMLVAPTWLFPPKIPPRESKLPWPAWEYTLTILASLTNWSSLSHSHHLSSLTDWSHCHTLTIFPLSLNGLHCHTLTIFCSFLALTVIHCHSLSHCHCHFCQETLRQETVISATTQSSLPKGRHLCPVVQCLCGRPAAG